MSTITSNGWKSSKTKDAPQFSEEVSNPADINTQTRTGQNLYFLLKPTVRTVLLMLIISPLPHEPILLHSPFLPLLWCSEVALTGLKKKKSTIPHRHPPPFTKQLLLWLYIWNLQRLCRTTNPEWKNTRQREDNKNQRPIDQTCLSRQTAESFNTEPHYVVLQPP